MSAPFDEDSHRSVRRAAMLTAGVGIAHAVLFLLAYWLMTTTPIGQAPDDEVRAFYASPERRRLSLVGLYIMPFAGIAFVWFIVALRMWINYSDHRENVLHSNVQLVSGILYVGLLFGAGATWSAAAASAEFTDMAVHPDVARQLPLYGSTLMFVFAVRMAAMFVFATTNIGRVSGILPRWMVVAGFAVGVFMLLSASFTTLLILAFPVWLLALCGLLLLRAHRIPATLRLPIEPHLRPADR